MNGPKDFLLRRQPISGFANELPKPGSTRLVEFRTKEKIGGIDGESDPKLRYPAVLPYGKVDQNSEGDCEDPHAELLDWAIVAFVYGAGAA